MTTTDLSRRTIPGTDLRIGRLILGCATFGAQLGEAESERAIHRARELGVTMFDSANSYGGGRAEEIIGRVVKRFRDEVQVVSKVGSYRTADAEGVPRLDRASILRKCDESLARLGLDHIDLYYLHMPDPLTSIEESLAACQELVAAGKVRYLGVSNYAAWQIADAVRLAEARGWPRVRASQPAYNLLARRIEEDYVDCTTRFAVANLVYNPLAGGLLTGKYREDQPPADGTRFAQLPNYRKRYWKGAQFDAIGRLSSIAAEAGMTLIELALRWLLTRDHVTGVILGISSVEHLEANGAAAAGPGPDDDTLAAIDGVWAGLRGPAPSYSEV